MDELKRDIGSPLAGDDNAPLEPHDEENDDDLDDPMDRELEEELDKTHPLHSGSAGRHPGKTIRSTEEVEKDEDEDYL